MAAKSQISQGQLVYSTASGASCRNRARKSARATARLEVLQDASGGTGPERGHRLTREPVEGPALSRRQVDREPRRTDWFMGAHELG